MGIADLIPGISGGTIALLAGIYEKWLESIQTLCFQSFKKIAWSFLLPLGGGVAIAILLFSRVLFFLMQNYLAPVLGFFFGLMAASTFLSCRSCHLRRPSHGIAFLSGGVFAFWLTTLQVHHIQHVHWVWTLLAGVLGAGAMLLPGISGSYLLNILGIYPLVIYALNFPLALGSFQLLLSLGCGIALGLILFSRLITYLMRSFYSLSLSVLVGLMGGGLKSVWPFGIEGFFWPASTALIGFFLVILLHSVELKTQVE
jgi:putative membrane protein